MDSIPKSGELKGITLMIICRTHMVHMGPPYHRYKRVYYLMSGSKQQKRTLPTHVQFSRSLYCPSPTSKECVKPRVVRQPCHDTKKIWCLSILDKPGGFVFAFGLLPNMTLISSLALEMPVMANLITLNASILNQEPYFWKTSRLTAPSSSLP